MTDQELHWDDKQRLCDALLKIRALHDPELRNLYVTELETQLRHALSVRRHSDARHDLFSIVSGCLSYPDGLRSFVQIVRGFQGESTAILAVEEIVAELLRPPVLSTTDRDELVRLLADMSPERIAAAYHDLFEPRSLQPQPNWHDTTAVIRRVETAESEPDRPPTVLIFVDRLAHQIDGGQSMGLHRFIDRVASGHGFNQAQIRQLCVETRRRLDEGRLPVTAGSDSTALSEGERPVEGDLTVDASLTAGVPVISTSPSTQPPALTIAAQQQETTRIWGGVPIRNPDFTGRDSELRRLQEALERKSKASVLPQTLHGLGGVGKTQLAVEYVYRNAGRYDLIWWISAEQQSLVLASLADLGRRLGVQDSEDLKQTVSIVLDALASSGLRWLLVFDNADDPEDIAPLVPSAGGHVILTSRNQTWANVWDAIEVDVFQRAESVALVRKRGEGITSEDADQLAAKLGDLPLALDQAASWQAATGMPVAEYLQLFDEHVNELLSEGKPTSYRTTVAAFVSLAFERLRDEAPAVSQLLELFAFLGAEPISVTLLRRGRAAEVSQPLSRALREPIFLNKTIRDLRRYGLAKVDANQRISMHRLVQLVLKEGLSDDLARRSRSNVHNLLASANPGEPDDETTWDHHAEVGPHVLPAGLVDAENPEARRVALDQIRYLYVRGDYEGARRLGERVVEAWRAADGEALGPDGELTLIATRHLANALRSLGDNARARRLDEDTLARLRRSPLFGEDHEHTIATAISVAVDLRVAGEYAAALDLDQEIMRRSRAIFGEGDVYTLRAANSVGVGLRMLGDFPKALDLDRATAREWEQTAGPDNRQTLVSEANVARNLYGLGNYQEALELQVKKWPTMRDQMGPRHMQVLLAARTIAIALRKTGSYPEALAQARENYRSYYARFGADHEHTLAAMMSYANTLRAIGELSEAHSLAADAAQRYHRAFGERHPLTLAAAINLAIVLRALGQLREARTIDTATHRAMRDVLGDEHGYTLCAANNLANDLVLAHDLAEARRLTTETLDLSRRVRGAEHPYTLACAANAAFDLQATGDESAGLALLDETIAAMERVLGPEHPETLDTARGKRAECDIEPPPT